MAGSGTKEGDAIPSRAKIPAGFIGIGALVAFVAFGGWSRVKSFSEKPENDSIVKLLLFIAYLGLLRIAYSITFIDKKPAPKDFGAMALLRWTIWNTLTHSMILFPISMVLSIGYLQNPTLKDIGIGILVHFVLTCFSMSVILHRYFSHAAYKANRLVTFILAILGCLAYQYGPIWWSSKHRRHHKECDKPNDPHSWARFGLGYAWIGWTMHPSEQNINMEYVHRSFKVGGTKDGKLRPELAFVDSVFFLPTWLMHAYLLFGVGLPLHTVVYRYTMPSALCAIATLWFNCKFHPPTKQAEMICNSIDLLHDPLAACHGEAYHKDHHKHPRRAKRPGPDLGYFLAILPLQMLGILGTSKGVTLKHDM